MAFKVHFYRFGKKPNSTAVPPESLKLLEIDAVLNDRCSVVNPVLVLNADLITSNPYIYNYCYIPLFDRYYFIEDWTWNNGIWLATCRVDTLATYKTDILNQVLYVLRSTYDTGGNLYYNETAGDSKYQVTADTATYQSSAIDNPFAQVDGVYCVGIINSDSDNGAVTYYTFNRIGFKYFCSQLFNYSSGWLNIDPSEISEDLQKALVNPFQYIVSCQYLPINVQDIINIGGTLTTNVKFGWWSVTVPTGARIVSTTMRIRRTTSLAIPRHPLAASRGRYLNVAPYSVYTLRYYPFGTLDIDSEAIAGWSTLDLYADLDVCTGKGMLNICVNGFNNPLRTVEAQIGVSIPTASLQTNYTNIAGGKNALMIAGATAAGLLNNSEGSTPNDTASASAPDPLAGDYARVVTPGGKYIKGGGIQNTIKQAASDVFNLAVAASTTAEIQGMQGNASAYNAQTLTLSGRFLPIVAEDLSHTGRPLMMNVALSLLRGFVQCKDADVAIVCTEREKSTIQAYLTGGFYIE